MPWPDLIHQVRATINDAPQLLSPPRVPTKPDAQLKLPLLLTLKL